MSGAALMRIEKLKGGNIITVAARHNRRELFEEGSIDPTRSHLNETIQGPPTADDVGKLARELMSAAGVPDKRRKDAVAGLEIMFSLAPNHQLDDRAYFASCTSWAADKFGGSSNILSVDIHRDEGAPHCHVLVLPLVHGRMNGSDMMGGPAQLEETLNQFYAFAESTYGLSRPPKRLQGASKRNAAALVLSELKRTHDAVLESRVWATVRDTLEREPGPWLVALGIELPTPKEKPLRTFTQIMTSKGAGPSREQSLKGFQNDQSLKGFSTTQKDQTLPCEGLRQNPPPSTPTQTAPDEALTIAESIQAVSSSAARLPDQPETAHAAVTPVTSDSTVMPTSRSTVASTALQAGSTRHARDKEMKTVEPSQEDGEYTRVVDANFDLAAWQCDTVQSFQQVH
jgi:hypothetical protein